LFGLPLRN